MSRHDNNPWTEAKLVQVRALWAEGHSTAEIGRRMDLSKNSIVGKVHRLCLPPRPSPIKGRLDGAPRQKAVPRIVGPTLAPLQFSSPSVPVQQPVILLIQRRSQPCCWPIGEPGHPSFHFCNAAGIAGKPYCVGHAAIAYQPKHQTADVA